MIIDAALLQRSRIGGRVTTVCDGSTHFDPKSSLDGNGERKKPRFA